MIAEALIREIAARFPSLQFATHLADGTDILIPAAHADVGAITIFAGDDEVTLSVGDITHGHFNDFREGVSDSDRAKTISDDVLELVESLLSDRVLLWKSGQAGGWRVLDAGEVPQVHSDAGTQFYLWSGPLST